VQYIKDQHNSNFRVTLARANWMRLTMILEELTTWMNIAHDISTWKHPPLTVFVTYAGRHWFISLD
jgi:hypothetical protein